MQIQHPTAYMNPSGATAQDDNVGDGTTSNILFIEELMKQSERYINEGVHCDTIVDGIELAKKKSLEYLELIKIKPESLDKKFFIKYCQNFA